MAEVDAIVIHPPDESAAPAKRTVLFPDNMRQLAGGWTGNVWPVVVCAYKKDEPINAILLDQVMLRQNETRFRLWIPDTVEYEIRAFNQHGLLESHVERTGNSLSVGLARQP